MATQRSFSRRLLDTSTPPFVNPLYTFSFVEDEPSLSFMPYETPLPIFLTVYDETSCKMYDGKEIQGRFVCMCQIGRVGCLSVSSEDTASPLESCIKSGNRNEEKR
jgi:hypothetical protein